MAGQVFQSGSTFKAYYFFTTNIILKSPKLLQKQIRYHTRLQPEFKHDLNQIYKLVHGLIPLPIVVCGLILSLIYIAAVVRAIRQHRVSRKCYVLLVNRASGDVLTCLIALGMSIYTMCVEVVR